VNAVLAVIALVTVASAAVALSRRNLLHSILILAGSWAGVAVFYFWAGSQFLAFAQVLVYLGAISMAALFAVLLTRHSRDDVAGASSHQRAVYAILTGIAVAAVLLAAVARTPLTVRPSAPPPLSVRELGYTLMGSHAAALLVVGVLLTVALIGAVVLAAGDPPDPKEGEP
jgi:NADH:ubiquinone oxidoreductase subunit 6 (subunit J)